MQAEDIELIIAQLKLKPRFIKKQQYLVYEPIT
jgi:hypothetical protein